ncbi:GNAT family N-acetyltransferase [Corynebacterium sp. NML140438]|uniref:GNAT family N-acetyltransferase n=1 Tax=Corynebacterium sp. NML140438 TaxID=1906334 RepID=UPI0008FB54A1|nr:GNAT family N-acetyltransferase [Corynebacterium sp. NML140438]OIR43736.1 GNAT family N-acetyltransferase [Corynebacterium sp. NML140438]
MDNAFPLRTSRLILTPPTDQDIDAILRIHADARTYRHRPDLAMKNRKEAEELARAWQENWEKQRLGYYVVSTLDGKTIGFTGVRHIEEAGEQVLNLYYRFAPESQGQGYAKEAASEAIANAQERFPQLPIIAIIDPTNEASIGLALRLGFQHVDGAGVPNDYDVYRLS